MKKIEKLYGEMSYLERVKIEIRDNSMLGLFTKWLEKIRKEDKKNNGRTKKT